MLLPAYVLFSWIEMHRPNFKNIMYTSQNIFQFVQSIVIFILLSWRHGKFQCCQLFCFYFEPSSPDNTFRLYTILRKRRGKRMLASGWLHPKPICNRCQMFFFCFEKKKLYWKWTLDMNMMIRVVLGSHLSCRLQLYIFLLENTDMGILIGNFDCGYSTVWKFSHFSTTLILREINFGWYHFWGFQWPKWISCNIGVAEKSWNFHIAYSQLGCPGL